MCNHHDHTRGYVHSAQAARSTRTGDLLRAGALALAFAACALVPTTAHAGFNSPFHNSLRPHLFHRCPKLANPIECTGNNHRNHHHHHSALGPRPHWLPSAHQLAKCTRLFAMFHARHPGRKPRGLRGTGCRMWAADARYHRDHVLGHAVTARGAVWALLR